MSRDLGLPIGEAPTEVQKPGRGDAAIEHLLANRWWHRQEPTGMPDQIGRFVIRRQLGVGGMGVVYAGYDRELDREVAVKLIRAGKRYSERVQTRLRREAQAMARLSHPNVVSVYEVGQYQGQLFVAMEMVEGETLRSWQTRQERSWREILSMYLQAGRGLAAAHARGIVHRDFKPDNVLVGSDGRARVVDFGLAYTLAPDAEGDDPEGHEDGHEDGHDVPLAVLSAVAPDASAEMWLARLTHTGALLGTVAYMSPEQFSGRRVDPRADQFSFCVALYEALYRQRPFAGRNLTEVAEAVTSGTVRAAPARARVPAWLRAILMRGLDTQPDRRFASMADLLEQLGRYRRTSRRLAAAGLALLLLGAGVGVAVGMRTQEPESAPCRRLSSAVQQSWNAGRASSLRTAFLGTDLPYAASAADGVERTLDAHAASWSTVRERACRAALVERTRSPELYDLQTACLDRQLVQLNALIEEFTSADAQVVEHAVSALAALPDSETCENVDVLRLGMQPPADAEVARAVRDLRARLAKTAAARLAGKYQPARAQARILVTDARAIDYPPVLAEALFELGSGFRHLGVGADAVVALQEAIDIAEANRHELLAVQAWNELIVAVAETRTDPARGRPWFRRARAAIERLGAHEGQRQQLLADAFAGLGHTEFVLGSLTDAERHHREALRLRRSALGGEHLHVARSLDRLASVLVRSERFDQAEALYNQALGILRRTLDEHHPDVGKQLFNIGFLYAARGDAERARGYYERALALYRDSYGADSRRTADVLLAIARMHARQGDSARTTTYARDALTIYERILPDHHVQRGKANQTLAAALYEEGRYDDALGQYRRALAVFQKASDPSRLDLAACHASIGETLMALARHGEALAPLQRAQELFVEVLGAEHTFVAYVLGKLGHAQASLARHGDAIASLERAAAIYADKNNQHSALAAVYFDLARALAGQGGARRRARDYAVRAHALHTSQGERELARRVSQWLSRH